LTWAQHSFPFFKESLIAALGIGTQKVKTAELADLKNEKNVFLWPLTECSPKQAMFTPHEHPAYS